ncbi:hypothetical protein PROFUN_04376 [Planoprotostelium fungivorum]|uniref:F-box domain-containing protein n=1 Tax=Planoprotostelium fungivorum TaxID=1890364 RepID=A0A2P6NHU0_9EUKA|nr:hypothetical protein PROFUN_04376 [Planoprotostelium fungivorum]
MDTKTISSNFDLHASPLLVPIDIVNRPQTSPYLRQTHLAQPPQQANDAPDSLYENKKLKPNFVGGVSRRRSLFPEVAKRQGENLSKDLIIITPTNRCPSILLSNPTSRNGKMEAVPLNKPYILRLPPHVLQRIFYHVEVKDLCRISRTCRILRDAIKDDITWRNVCFKTGTGPKEKPEYKSWHWLAVSKLRVWNMDERKQGPGTLLFENKGQPDGWYYGDWEKGRRHGFGVRSWANGNKYAGDWVNDVRHGDGVFIYPDGSFYSGKLEKGQFTFGTYRWSNGRTYKGQFEGIKRQGNGQYIWEDGRIYEGGWYEDKRHGPGKLMWPNGDFFEGTFIEGKRSGPGKLVTRKGDVYQQNWREKIFDEKNRGIESGPEVESVAIPVDKSSDDVSSGDDDMDEHHDHSEDDTSQTLTILNLNLYYECSPEERQNNYELKKVDYFGRRVNIILQNENGPCPLIAIGNVLLLSGKMELSLDYSAISNEQLLHLVAECLTNSNLHLKESEEVGADYQKNMSDAINLLPHMLRGMDINVRFGGYNAYEYTPECIIFDLLGINLVHGWLVDPTDKVAHPVLCNLSYNKAMEKLVESSVAADTPTDTKNEEPIATINTPPSERRSKVMVEASVIESFFSSSPTQLTYHGLYELHKNLSEGSLSVFFRGNHFSTLIKHKGCLYVLVTDAGFRNESVVWEKLEDIDNDGDFYLGDFNQQKQSDLPPIIASAIAEVGNSVANLLPSLNSTSESYAIDGYVPTEKEVQEQLDIEEKIRQERKKEDEERDRQLALQLMKEEERENQEILQQQVQEKKAQQKKAQETKKEKDCIIS